MQDSKETNNALFAALLFCFFLGGIFFKYNFWKRAEPMTLGDLYFYQGLAIAFENHDWSHFWHFHFYPAYPVLISWLHRLSGLDYVPSARWLNIVFDGLSVVPVYLIGRELYGKRIGIFSALFWSFCWPYFRIYGDPEPVYAFFVFLAIWLALKKDAGWKRFLAAAALTSFSGLIKSEASFFVGLVFLFYFFRGKDRLRLKIGMALAGVLVYLFFTAPIWVNYYRATHEFNPNPKSKTLYFIHNPTVEYQLFLYGLREDDQGLYTNGQRIYIEGDKDALKTPLMGFVRDNFQFLSHSYFVKLWFTLKKGFPVMVLRIFPGAFLLFILFFARRARDFRPLDELWPWLWALLFIVALAFFDTWERFLYSIFPALAIICAKGLDRLLDFSLKTCQKFLPRSPRLAAAAGSLLPALFIAWYLFYNISTVIRYEPERKAAEQINAKQLMAKGMKDRISPESIIMCRGFPEPVTYFLGIPFWQMVITPMADLEDLVKYGRQRQVNLFFIEESDLARNPIIEPWLWGEAKDPWVMLLKHVPRQMASEFYPSAWYKFLKNPAAQEPVPQRPELPDQTPTLMH
jgi:4-amino-4-deoxy-L-arabinose transferase-like glycosyltransferase